MKKILFFLIATFIFLFWFIFETSALDIISWDRTTIPYCTWNDCGLEQWVEYTQGVDGLVTNWTASSYIQRIVVYFLTFLKLVAVILIIYAWFNMLTSAWDEEKAKKSKTIIVFAIIWLLIIYLAWPITNLIIDVLTWA